MRRLLLALIALLLLAPPPARAYPVTIGNGSQPNLAVDAAGTAYIAWYDNATSQLHFCRLPRNAAACDVNTTLPVDGQTLYRPFIRVEGAQVDIFNSRYGFSRQPLLRRCTSTPRATAACRSARPPRSARWCSTRRRSCPAAGCSARPTPTESGGAVQYMLGGLQTQRAILFPQTYLYDGTVAFLDATITAVAVFTDSSSNARVPRLPGP